MAFHQSGEPQPAATVVIIRETGRGREVLLTRRPDSMKFLGGFFVFPGGKVDSHDISDRAKSRVFGLPENLSGIFDPNGHDAIGFYTAGIRELFEESKILLLCDESGSLIPHEEYRRMKKISNISHDRFLDEIVAKDLFFSCNRLHFLQLFITPKPSPIRFYTTFFYTFMPEGQEVEVDSHEVAEAFWISTAAALKKYHEGKFPMIPPTVFALEMVQSL